MSAALVVAAVALAAASGVPGLFLAPGGRAGERVAVALLGLGAALGLWVAVQVLSTGEVVAAALWAPLPSLGCTLRVDALSAFFLVPIFGASALGAVYGLDYWPEAEHPKNGRKLRFAYGLIAAGLATVAVAGDAILFLFGWEVMALAAFVAVGTEDHLPAAREASYLYLVTTRIGTLCLFAAFALLHAETKSFALAPFSPSTPERGTALFLLALLGFGLKAGLMPLHVWLPPAHAAAPSHVSALMSGVLIKIGVYGLVRVLSLLPAPPLWWGLLLLLAGAASGVLGVAFAIAQHDLKRLLAYHSIENIGIIVLGLGAATLGRALGRPELVALGLAGALLHVWNHGLFKGLLFLSAGAVVHATGTRQIDRLGGLLGKMPWAASLFLLGAVAISGLPPLNGFVSELFVYLGLFFATGVEGGSAGVAALLSIGALALIGGLALACFAKVFGAVFLGSARSPDTDHAHDAGPRMLGPMLVLAFLCVLIGVAPVAVATPLDHAVGAAFGPGAAPSASRLAPLASLGVMAAIVLGLGLLGSAMLRRRLAAAPAATGPTWDCGYAAPTARMQYTSSSFAEQLVGLFSWALLPRRHAEGLSGLAPPSSRFETHVDDSFLERVCRPAVSGVAALFRRLAFLQPGRLHLYVLYVMATVVALVLWAQKAPR